MKPETLRETLESLRTDRHPEDRGLSYNDGWNDALDSVAPRLGARLAAYVPVTAFGTGGNRLDAPTATYPCIWCGTPLDECGDPPCCPENDHPYRTAQETIAAIRADEAAERAS